MEILLICPEKNATGGTESIHNLASNLNKVGADAKILYKGTDLHNPQPKEFENYNVGWVTEIPKDFNGCIIFPEVYANQIIEPKYKNIMVAVNWQGVDVYDWNTPVEKRGLYLQRKDAIHIANFEYALDTLRKRGLHPVRIDQVLNDDFFNIPNKKCEKSNVVLYNPVPIKLTQLQKDVMAECEKQGIEFKPIQGYTREELIDLFQHHKLYLDLGQFSGRERLPREAVMCGTCIITSRSGAAGYEQDNTIPDKYKVTTVEGGVKMVKYVLENYNKCRKDYDTYRKALRHDKEYYTERIRNLYEVLQRKANKTTSQVKYSIVIPAYNSSQYIRNALNSIRQQTFTDYELIVVCDSCVDNTYDIAKEYTDKVYQVKFGNDGLTRSRGLDEATGEWVLFMDDDDWWMHEYVLELIDNKLNELPIDTDVLCFSFIFHGLCYATPRGNRGDYWIAVWNKCWRREAIGDTRFPNVPMCSDRYFHKAMMKKDLKIEEWDMPLYYYNYLRTGSQTEISKSTKTVAVQEPVNFNTSILERKKQLKETQTPKYMIHTYPGRRWYVDEYLVPSMKAQGIPMKDIIIFEDTEGLGNLKACMKAFSMVPDDDSGTWHLQDDVVISKHFTEKTRKCDDGLVNGFCSKFNELDPPGVVTPVQMWYSFPCIRIPNILARQFVKWFYHEAIHNNKYSGMIAQNKHDDELFRLFISTKYPNLKMRNISPNLVDHVDYLLGGSSINKAMQNDRRSLYWNEEDVIKNLIYQLKQRKER